MCMDFGRLKDISGVDFSLPEEDPYSQMVLRNHPNFVGNFDFRLGAPAWSCTEWKGKIYPDKSSPSTFLHHYAQHFDTIELNSTHYGIPQSATILKWKSSVGDYFRFCPKMLQSVSHRKRLNNVQSDVDEFTDQMRLFEHKLGYTWLQMPPDFDIQERKSLFTFLEKYPSDIPLALELRHDSWFKDQAVLNDLSEIMTERSQAMIITDVAGRRDVLHMRVTTPVILIRFVGNELSPTDFSRVDLWLKRIDRFKQQGLQEVYFFAHQPEDILCPEIGNHIGKKSENDYNWKFTYPILREKAEQRALF